MRKPFLISGIASALVYILTDIGAGLAHPGYHLADQAVSELFAIGAPLSQEVARLFSLSSLLLLTFAYGIWSSAGNRKREKGLAACFACSALVGLALWNCFPMHMRGEEKTLTDTVHLVLATNPFVVLSLALALSIFSGWFRWVTVLVTVAMVLLAVSAFRHAPAVGADLPTPGLGLAERAAQYLYLLWQAGLSLLLYYRSAAALVRRNDLPGLP